MPQLVHWSRQDHSSPVPDTAAMWEPIHLRRRKGKGKGELSYDTTNILKN
jgi:hypothetical protein